MDIINDRIKSLRTQMRLNNLSAYIIPSTDPHSGEYIPEYWHSRQWISGFTGSAGTAVVTLTGAALWTDSRYFIQAADQLRGTEFTLMRERVAGTPTIAQWLASQLSEGEVVGIDGSCATISYVGSLRDELCSSGIALAPSYDLITPVWTDRPAIPADKPFILPVEYTGSECADKLRAVRDAIRQRGASSILLSALDEIAWTLNMRGTDVHCNPVFVSYLYISLDSATLFIDSRKLTDEVVAYLHRQGVDIEEYSEFYNIIRGMDHKAVLLTEQSTNHAIAEAIGSECRPIADSPVALLKAVKNEVETEGFRRAMVRDCVALVRFLRWLLPAVAEGGQTEMSIDRKLTALRAEQPLFQGISFDTIAGYREHGAIVHYEATPETDAPLAPEGLLLLDSGAQYLDGTTD
ncbi:MAG: aminopeptidase P family N-terminal domain-containing protein, partial [Bacteroidaceae bacterium]|nr:aminopeptidase P family N-terminal domain-containing protein [Bacteroidaceae bacterium]